MARCYPSLQTALDDCRVDDVIVVSKGIHSLLNVNSLRHGGTLLGESDFFTCGCRMHAMF